MVFERDVTATNGAGPGLERVLGADPTTWRQWRTWGRAEPALAGLDDDRLRRELKDAGQDRADALLGALVRLAQTGPHPDTALVLVARCLLPGLRHRVSHLASSLDRDEAFSVMVTALIERVRSYPLAERPGFVATFLLETPTRRLRCARDMERTWASYARSVPDTAATVTDTGTDVTALPAEALLGLAVAAGVVRAADAWLIDATRTHEVSLTDAAWCLGLSYPAAAKRRWRAERRWAAWWAPDHPGHHDRKERP